MATKDEILAQLDENFTDPAEADVDGVRVKQHNLRDQIAMARFKRSSEAAAGSSRGFRISRIVPPGGC